MKVILENVYINNLKLTNAQKGEATTKKIKKNLIEECANFNRYTQKKLLYKNKTLALKTPTEEEPSEPTERFVFVK